MRDHLCNLRWEAKETRGDSRAKLELLSKRREGRLLVIARKGSYKVQLAKGVWTRRQSEGRDDCYFAWYRAEATRVDDPHRS